MNATIVYYSRTGNTCLIAECLANTLDGQLIPIHAGDRYRGALSAYIVGSLHAAFGFGSRYELSAAIPSDTDLLIIGSPVWSDNVTPPVRSFLLQNNQVCLMAFFSTGSRISKRCIRTMQSLVQNSTHVISTSSFLFAAGYSETELTKQVKDWASVLFEKFNKKES